MKKPILRAIDWNGTWPGFRWLRHQPVERITVKAALTIVGLTSLLTVLFPAFWANGIPSQFEIEPGHIRPEFFMAWILATVVANSLLQILSAVVWNQRTTELRVASKSIRQGGGV